ncbi:MAG: peptidoglycan-binding protein, partial [Acetobacteraceae bacterium]|nr:peptidoglycan-binding protein [Acetobacteraceae bacterium]
VLFALFLLCAGHARAEPDPNRLALVIGNSAYAALPALPACVASAHAVTAALRRRGFDVLERDDTSNGELRAALGTYERRLIAADKPTSVVYVCGYGTGYDDRPFLLPVSASLQRDTDILTEGLIASVVTDLSARATPRLTVTLLDVFARPGFPPPPLAGLVAQPANGAAVMLAAIEPSSSQAPTPFAEALVAELASPAARARDLAAAARRALQAKGGSPLAPAVFPADDAIAAAPSSQAPPTSSPSPAPSSAAAPPATAGPPTQPQPQPPPATPPALQLDEDRLGDAARRQVQAQLKRLGYYPGQIDGVFGPDTRAAIRRFQFELGADMSGRLTPAEIARLLAHAGATQGN